MKDLKGKLWLKPLNLMVNEIRPVLIKAQWKYRGLKKRMGADKTLLT